MAGMKTRGEPGDELDRLVRRMLPEARAALEESGSFPPFGAAVLRRGGIRRLRAETDVTAQSPTALVAGLNERFRRGARRGTYAATVAVIHVAVHHPGGCPRDAVQLKLDHCAGTSLELFFPYRFKRPGVATFGHPFSREGHSEIFAPAE